MQSTMSIEEEPTEDDTASNPLKKKWPQVAVVLGTTLAQLATGTTLGFSAVALPALNTSRRDEFQATNEQLPWIASSLFLGSLIGCLLTGIFLKQFGRRRVIMITCVLFVMGWMLIGQSKNVIALYLGRFITGMCNTFLSTVVPVYATEITDTELLRTLKSLRILFDIMESAGILLIAIAGMLVHWRTAAWMCTVLPILLYVFMFHVPESPYWLYSEERLYEMEESIIFLRGSVNGVNLSDYQKDFQESTTLKKILEELLIFRKPTIWRPFVLCFGLFIIKIFSGAYAILFFGVSIFQTAGGVVNSYTGNVIINVFRVVGTIPGSLLLHRLDCRHLFSLTSIILTVTMTLTGIYFCIKENISHTKLPSVMGCFPVINFLVFNMFFALGIEQVPGLIVDKIFQPKCNSIVNKSLQCLVVSLSFIMVQFFQTMMNTMTGYGTFWFFSFVCFCGIFYPYMFLPEICGKSSQEIKNYFKLHEDNSTD